MDKDVNGKLERLCGVYLQAQAQLSLGRPNRPVTKRGASRATNYAVNVLGRLQEARKPAGAALVRLAYVRALRGSQPQARLTEEQVHEVEFFEQRMDYRLGVVEGYALMNHRNHLRRLNLVQWATQQGWPESAMFGLTSSDEEYNLEQWARANILSVLETASMAGSLAGTQAASYDGVA